MTGLELILNMEGITGVELSQKIGVTTSLVSRWINGKKPIPVTRIIQIHKLFPQYPAEYIDKTLSEADKLFLHNIKTESGNKTDVNSPLFRIKEIIERQYDERQKVLDDMNEILNVTPFQTEQMLNNNQVSKRLLLSLFEAVSNENELMLHDYQRLNKLEKFRKNSEEENSPARYLISVVLSALCEVFEIGDEMIDLIKSQSQTFSYDNSVKAQLFEEKAPKIYRKKIEITELFRKLINENDI